MHIPSVLVIEDENQIRKLLRITLESSHFHVHEAATAKDGLTAVAIHPPDLVLLDLGLPDESGHEVLKHMREWFTNPIIILSVQSSEENIVKALDNGADDFIAKPFRTEELVARVRSAIQKSQMQENSPLLTFNDLTVDFLSRTVKKENTPVKLTSTEYSLLSLLVRNEGKVLTHQFLLTHVWGPGNQNELQHLRVFIATLRKKIENDPNRPLHILTESGVGYRFTGNNS